MYLFGNPISIVRKLYELACPFGRKKLAIVFAFIVVQGLLQVVGVTSIFPFLALASNPGQARDSEIGAAILGKLPAMSDDTLLIIAGLLAILMLFLSNGMLLLGEVVGEFSRPVVPVAREARPRLWTLRMTRPHVIGIGNARVLIKPLASG
mgnify:CR=1 FL=1